MSHPWKQSRYGEIGEPLSHPNIAEMIAEANGIGFKTELITNGALLTSELSVKLINAGLDSIVVSLDSSTPRTFSDIRDGSSLDIVIHNMKSFNDAKLKMKKKKPEIGIEFVVMKRNISELKDLRNLAQTIDAGFIMITNLLPYTEDMNDEILYWLSARDCFPIVRSRNSPEIIMPRIDSRAEI